MRNNDFDIIKFLADKTGKSEEECSWGWQMKMSSKPKDIFFPYKHMVNFDQFSGKPNINQVAGFMSSNTHHSFEDSWKMLRMSTPEYTEEPWSIGQTWKGMPGF